jgi:hypothetical protein
MQCSGCGCGRVGVLAGTGGRIRGPVWPWCDVERSCSTTAHKNLPSIRRIPTHLSASLLRLLSYLPILSLASKRRRSDQAAGSSRLERTWKWKNRNPRKGETQSGYPHRTVRKGSFTLATVFSLARSTARQSTATTTNTNTTIPYTTTSAPIHCIILSLTITTDTEDWIGQDTSSRPGEKKPSDTAATQPRDPITSESPTATS